MSASVAGRRPPRRLRALDAMFLILALAHGHLLAQSSPSPRAAIEYLEHPEAGPLTDRGRKLKTDGRGYNGIDVNSVLDINIDAPKLRAALLDQTGPNPPAQRVRELLARLQALQRAADLLNAEMNNVGALLDLWKGGDTEQFNAQLRASATRRFQILEALRQAKRQRLLEGGADPRLADARAKSTFDPVLSGPKLRSGYDWDLLAQLFKEELEAADADLRKIEPELGLGIGIQAHLISKEAPDGVPIFLPNYNTEKTGPRRTYEKLKTAASDSELQLYDQYKKIAAEMGEAKSSGDALTKLLQAQLDAVRPDLNAMAAAAEQALSKFQGEIRNLEAWASAEKRTAWLDSAKAALAAHPEGARVLRSWDDLDKTLHAAREDVEALKAYVDIRKSIAGESAPEAMGTILRIFNTLRVRDPGSAATQALDVTIWTARMEKVKEFLAAVEALQPALRTQLTAPGSPYADLKTTREAFQAFADAVKQGATRLSQWIGLVFAHDTLQTVANLPVPEGNRQLAVAGNALLGTSVNLTTIRSSRNVGDAVRVQYSFSQGQRESEGGWTDTFLLQSYGWQSEVIASLAFARQAHAPTWKPTAAMNWILSYRSWPGEYTSGLKKSGISWFSGVGISAMPLNSVAGQDLEIGLGFTLAFLNNRLLVGYGSNLQAPNNKGFAFMSIRLLSFPGLSGPAGGIAQ